MAIEEVVFLVTLNTKKTYVGAYNELGRVRLPSIPPCNT